MVENNQQENEESWVEPSSQENEPNLNVLIPQTTYHLVPSEEHMFQIQQQEKVEGEEPKLFDFSKHKPQYNSLAEFVIEFVQNQMKQKYGLKEVWIPEKHDLEEQIGMEVNQEQFEQLPKNNIFMSSHFRNPDLEKNAKTRALVLIQGTGEVRAGIWARSVCINENFQKGSMLPFVDECVKQDMAILVMNPNLNRDPESGQHIPGSDQMTVHAVYVWNKYVQAAGFKDISVVAHSAGGGCLKAIQEGFPDSFYDMVTSIAYTDSWVIPKSCLNATQAAFMQKRAIHYEASTLPLGQSIESENFTCPVVSAGHKEHAFTTGYAYEKILEQFKMREQKVIEEEVTLAQYLESLQSGEKKVLPEPEEIDDEVIEKALKLKTQGNDLFKAQNYQGAVEIYSEAIFLDISHADKAQLYVNKALCNLKMENTFIALLDATDAIKLDPTNVKAFYRRGQAQMAINQPKQALISFKMACQLDPTNNECKNKYEEANEICKNEQLEKAAE